MKQARCIFCKEPAITKDGGGNPLCKECDERLREFIRVNGPVIAAAVAHIEAEGDTVGGPKPIPVPVPGPGPDDDPFPHDDYSLVL